MCNLSTKVLTCTYYFLQIREIGIGCSNWPITDFFHDQTIFIKDCELYTIVHSENNCYVTQNEIIVHPGQF